MLDPIIMAVELIMRSAMEIPVAKFVTTKLNHYAVANYI
jgi:hypothetical protein